ncbi:alpha-amylase family protein [Devosia sp.]|uniref:alpha-amylase family protein n=1 Tax=Devosia sp. TaxID=1871048 RepID=UPI003BAAE945
MQTLLESALDVALGELGGASKSDRNTFDLRFRRSFADLYAPLQVLYGHLPEFEAVMLALARRLAAAWANRGDALKLNDLRRDLEPDWFLRPDMVGYVFYLDRFNADLKGVLDKLDYLEDLGVTYVHFMPCLMPRPGDSDGGYSVMDYRQIDPRFGTMADMETVTAALRERGISVCIDLVLNHTAKEHEWAKKARAGDRKHQAFYWMFDDRTQPDIYERSLLEIFPEHAPGNFTWYEDAQKWVWTTFNEHQWDLNWSNPEVMLEIIDIMLFLANQGVEAVRLDAVAFMWKRPGTQCQNEPEVHQILHALRAASRIAAPALIHKEEAIVSPKQLIPYLGVGEHTGKEGNLAYHNSLMVQFWSALATRSTSLMTRVMGTHFPSRFVNATWGTYLRCHDDIGWAITDEDAGALGMDGSRHRSFLADFYEGHFPGSFARGGAFQSNPATGDRRTNGSCASLCGLETALEAGDANAVSNAIQRILMGHALIASFGGVPLLYMGDELGMTNDQSYLADPHLSHDSRWMHRPKMDWERAQHRHDQTTVEGQIYSGISRILARRKATLQLHADNPTEILDAGIDGVFAFRRVSPTGNLVGLFNFTENWLPVSRAWVAANGVAEFWDHLSEAKVETPGDVVALPPYARAWMS